jgi:O-antigen ligase
VATAAATLSDPSIVGAARRLRAISWALEGGLGLSVAGSALAIGSVHPWAYVPLWCLAVVLGGLMLLRGAAVVRLRAILGWTDFSFHPAGRWLVLDAQPSYGLAGWTFDLRRPLLPRPPLLVPGLLFAGWVCLQLAPLPPSWSASTVSPRATMRGLAFLVAMLLIHLSAAAVLDQREARERFRRVVAFLGFTIALVGVVQLGAGAERIYGFFEPVEHGIIFGPFANRNHFAGYMLMVVPTCLALLSHAWSRYAGRVGEAPNARRRILALGSAQGAEFLYAALPASVAIAALVATTSRGALIAFALGFCLAGLGLRRGARGVPAWAITIAFVLMAVSWFGIERLATRFGAMPTDAPGRTLVWRDSLRRMGGLWLRGSGFNSFAAAMSGATPWELPRGADPWPEEIEAAREAGRPAGVRVAPGVPGMTWYREAHNDYLQVLVETGLPGLALALWGAFALLRSARQDPWLLMALSGVLLQSGVEFDLQIPAIAVLFVALGASRSRAAEAQAIGGSGAGRPKR